MMHCIKTGEGACFCSKRTSKMKTSRLIPLAVGLLAAATAHASDATVAQVLAAAVALPAVGEPGQQLHARTEALMRHQIAEINERMTTSLTGTSSEPQSTQDRQLALSSR
jgi:hypothetical protein